MRSGRPVPHDRPREERHQRRNTITAFDRVGTSLRGDLRPLPVGRRARRSARAPAGARRPGARIHRGNRQRHRPQPGPLPRRPRRARRHRTGPPDASPPREASAPERPTTRGSSGRRRSGCRSPTDRSTRSCRRSCCAPWKRPSSRCAKSVGSYGPMVSSSSWSMSAPTRRGSPPGRTGSPSRGVASREAVVATARRRS